MHTHEKQAVEPTNTQAHTWYATTTHEHKRTETFKSDAISAWPLPAFDLSSTLYHPGTPQGEYVRGNYGLCGP